MNKECRSMTFRKYYADQFKQVPVIISLEKWYKKPLAFIVTMLVLLCPLAVYVMYLYDSGKIKATDDVSG